MKNFIHILILILTVFSVSAQLTTTVQSPVNLVQNVLLGDPGITVSNVTFQGAPSAIGRFTANNTNLGISSGIVMTTGTILSNAEGPLGPNNAAGAGVDNGTPGYPLLTGLVGRQTYNASVLSFDFQTCSDSIEFRYVFGSEEYPEYVGSQFNDIFGFFISGPGFSGQQNIARLPNGSTVAINNVNNGNNQPATGVNPTGPSNPQFFVPNGNGSQAPYNQTNIYIQYDGFTKVLTAKAKIQCNATYRLTLAIADVGDGVWDSGIFLEANSFKANDPLKVSYTLDNKAFDEPDVLAEPCAEATIRLSRTDCNINNPLTINISTSGSATNGVDYQTIPTTVTIPAGALYTEYKLTPIYDGINEGTENVQFSFNYLDNCGDPRVQDLELFIRDIDPMDFTLQTTTPTCPGDDVQIESTVSGGGGRYQYLWSTGETTESITVNPLVTTTYTLTVTDDCIQEQVIKNITVNVPTFTPISLSGTPNVVEICPYTPTDLYVTPSGGFGGYTYQWFSDKGEVFGRDSMQNVTPANTTEYFVQVTDACGLVDTFAVLYTITSSPLIVSLNPEIEVCPGDSVLLTSIVTGGYGNYYYHWLHSGETTPNVWVNPYRTTSYILVVQDECQTFSVSDTTRVLVVYPNADFQLSSSVPFNNIELTFQNLSTNASTYIWEFGDGNTSTIVHPNHTYFNPGDYLITLVAVDDKGCMDTVQKYVTIIEEHYVYIPNTFTPDDGGRVNNEFEVSTYNVVELEIEIYNRWGQMVYSSNLVNFRWDGSYKGKPVPDGTYTYKVSYTARSGFSEKLNGHVNVLR